MTTSRQVGFPQSVAEKIGFYVYLLQDPFSDEVFYVGKGSGNRAFSHLLEPESDVSETAKRERIRRIRAQGREPTVVIHRHGLSERAALEVEASLIDFIGVENLTNVVQGIDLVEHGQMTPSEILARYGAKPVTISEPAILVRVNRSYRRGMTPCQIYDITRGDWVLGEGKRRNARFAMAVLYGVVREVYTIKTWEPVQIDNPRVKQKNRWRFVGSVAQDLQHYVNGSVAHYLSPGAQNPVRFLNCEDCCLTDRCT